VKILRFFSLIIVMSLLVAWAPSPTTPQALVKPSLLAPSTGAYILATTPTDFRWKRATTGDVPATYWLQISRTTSFSNPADIVFEEEGIPSGGTETTYQVPPGSLPTNVKLTWRVIPQLDSVDGPASSTRYVLIRPLKPDAPLYPLNGEVVHAVRPVLNWGSVENVTAFDVQISLNNTFTSIKSSGVSLGETYTPASDLARNTTYFYRIRSRAVTTMTRLADEWLFLPSMTFKTPVNPPTAPVLTAPASGATSPTKTPTFIWKAATTTDPNNLPLTYVIQLATDSKFVNIVIDQDEISDTFYTLPLPLETGTYYWRVRAVDNFDDMGNWSSVRVIKTLPALHILVRDYLSKEPIPGAPLTISGTGLPTGPYVTDAEGYYKIEEINPGSRTVSALVPDYVKKTLSTSVAAGTVKVLVLEPVHIPMKVELTWPSTPKLDFDLNLWIPETYDTGAPNYAGHIRNNLLGSTTKYPWSKLAADDTTPAYKETITIQNRYPGKYVVAVFNKNYANGNLSGSGAKVTVTRGTQKWEFTVPATNPGYRWWYVFDMLGETGVPVSINQMQVSPAVDYDPYPGDYAVPPQP
jgi:hypothetical protein